MTSAVLDRLQSALSGRYRVVREVSRGGMGTVFEAEDLKHRRPVAIKVLNPEQAEAIGASRFQAEIEIAARLTHPHIVPLHDSGVADTLLYYVMPLIAGESLRQRLMRERQLPIEDALRITREICDALHYAHAQGLVHRDIKPDNIVLSGGHALVLDFGIAQSSAPAGSGVPTRTLAVAGTPLYMSPEQVSGALVDPRSDQYSLACVLYEMLAGQPPFTGASPDSIALQHRTLEPRPVTALRPTVPQAVADSLARALAKAPADRYSSIASFADALGSIPTPLGGRREALTPTPGGLPGGRVMLAVLPLENLSSDPEQEFFTDGMTEELIAHLGRLQPRRLGVIARTSAMRYKKTQKSVDEIGRELGVDHVLEGSVRRAGERLRITVQLIQVADQTHLWAENYDRRMADVFDIQSEVAGSVAKALEVQLLPSGKAAGSAGVTASTAAYEAYLKGRFHWNRRTKEGFERAIECFERAIAEDPGYARAYAGLADVYAVLPAWGLASVKEVGPKAEMNARRALQLDPNLAEAHASLGAVLSNQYSDFEGSERELRRAIELDPGYITAYYWLATALDAQERHDEALILNERAKEMDPQSLIVTYNLGVHFLALRDYDRALRHFQALLALDPGFVTAHMYIGLIRAYQGEHAEGIRYLTSLGPPVRDDWRLVGVLGYLHGLVGRLDEARAALGELERRKSSGERIGPMPFIRILLTLGEREKAFDFLERGIHEEEVPPYLLPRSPVFDAVRDDPRFQALLEESKRQAAIHRARAGSGG